MEKDTKTTAGNAAKKATAPKELPTVTLSEFEASVTPGDAPEELGEPTAVLEGAVEFDG